MFIMLHQPRSDRMCPVASGLITRNDGSTPSHSVKRKEKYESDRISERS